MSGSPQLLAVDPYERLQGQVFDAARLAQRMSVLAGVQGAGTITGEHIVAGSITTGSIAAGSITTELLAAGAVTAEKITAGTITADRIAAGTITGDRIAANTITAALIVAATITGDRIAADTIVAGNIAAAAIQTNELQAGAVTAAKIAAGTIVAGNIAAGTITAVQIAAASITGAVIAAGTITATNIATGTLTGNLLAGATITGDKIVAGTITADKLNVSTLSAVSANLGTVTAGKVEIGAAGAAKVAIGQTVSTSIGTVTGIVGTDATNAITFYLAAGTGDLYLKGSIQPGSTGLGNIAGQIDGGTSIVPVSITGDRLVAHTITATQIAAATITGTEIAAVTITGGHIAAGTITAANIAAGTITADRIAAGTITSTQLSATAIDAMTITGATFRTSATVPGVLLNSAGLKAFDAAGVVTLNIPSNGTLATFTGKINALGLDLTSGTSTSPPDARRVRWLRESNPAQRVAQAFAYEAGGIHVGVLGALSPNGTRVAEVQPFATDALAGIAVAAGGTARRILQDDGASSFMQDWYLGGTAVRMSRVNYGKVATFPWSGTDITSINVAHGLGVTPIAVFATPGNPDTADARSPLTISAHSFTSTHFTITMATRNNAAIGVFNMVGPSWIAIAN